MAYMLIGNEVVLERPEPGVLFRFENPCSGRLHAEETVICMHCGRDFCASCDDNVMASKTFITCPGCGWSWYE